MSRCKHARKQINSFGYLYCFDCGTVTGPRAMERIAELEADLRDYQLQLDASESAKNNWLALAQKYEVGLERLREAAQIVIDGRRGNIDEYCDKVPHHRLNTLAALLEGRVIIKEAWWGLYQSDYLVAVEHKKRDAISKAEYLSGEPWEKCKLYYQIRRVIVCPTDDVENGE